VRAAVSRRGRRGLCAGHRPRPMPCDSGSRRRDRSDFGTSTAPPWCSDRRTNRCGLAHVQPQIRRGQPEQFAAPHAGGKGGNEDGAQWAGRRRRVRQEGGHLLVRPRPDLPLRLVPPGQLHLAGHDRGNQFGNLPGVQQRGQDPVQPSNAGVGERSLGPLVQLGVQGLDLRWPSGQPGPCPPAPAGRAAAAGPWSTPSGLRRQVVRGRPDTRGADQVASAPSRPASARRPAPAERPGRSRCCSMVSARHARASSTVGKVLEIGLTALPFTFGRRTIDGPVPAHAGHHAWRWRHGRGHGRSHWSASLALLVRFGFGLPSASSLI